MSVEAIGAAVAEAGEQLRQACGILRTAEARLAEAAAVLSELDRLHSGSLVPPQLCAAQDGLARGLTQLAGGLAATERFVAAL